MFSREGFGIGSCQAWSESRLVLRDEGGNPSTVVVVVALLNRDNGGVGRPCWVAGLGMIAADRRMFSGAGGESEGGLDDDDG